MANQAGTVTNGTALEMTKQKRLTARLSRPTGGGVWDDYLSHPLKKTSRRPSASKGETAGEGDNRAFTVSSSH